MGIEEQPKSERKAKERSGRHAARVAAVQATYQVDATGVPANRVLSEFVQHRLPSPEAQSTYAGADEGFFAELVRGVAKEKPVLDEAIEASLAKGWSIGRIDSVLRAILRCGAFEVMCRLDIPPKASISEYVEVTRGFFEGDEPGFVNAVLDAMARKARATEMGNGSGAEAAGSG